LAEVKSDLEAESQDETEEEEELIEEPASCDLCGQTPCDWETFGEDIWEECNGLKKGCMEKKAVRFHAYKLYTHMCHGISLDRRQLPVCVRGEIMDSWPDPNHVYTGFQQAMKDVAED
jgi:hypothetical protein